MSNRNASIKIMIETGHITEFRQIFNYFPKSWLRDLLHIGNARAERLKAHAEYLTMDEVFSISAILDVDHLKMTDLIYRQHVNSNKKKK